MRKYFFLLLYVLLSFCAQAQGIDRNDDQSKVVEYIIIRDFVQAKALIETQFIKTGDLHKKVVGYVYAARIFHMEGNTAKGIEALEKAKELAEQSKKLEDRAYVNYGYADLYMRLQKWDLGLRYSKQALADFKQLPYEQGMIAYHYINKLVFLETNPLYSSDSMDYKAVIHAAEKSKIPMLVAIAYNDLCIYYSRQYDKTLNTKYRDSIFMHNKHILPAIEQVKGHDIKNYLRAMYHINYGSYLILQHKNQESLAHFNKGIGYTLDGDTWKEKWLPFAYNGIGCNYEELNDWGKAEQYYLKALAASSSKISYAHLKIINTKNLSNTYAKKKDFEKAYRYQLEATDLVTKHAENQKSQAIEMIEVLHKTQEKSLKIEQLEKDRKTADRQRWLYIGIIFLGGIGIAGLVYVLKFRNKLLKQEKELLKAQKNEIELSFQLQQEETCRLESEQELLLLQLQQIRKDAIANSLRLANHEKYLSDLNEQIKDQDPAISRMIREQKLVDQELSEVQAQINNIHPNFFNSLKQVAKVKLTKIDLKYATYIYMDLDNQQIANILHVDLNTVRVTKFRFKQKIGLRKDENLLAYIQQLAKNL